LIELSKIECRSIILGTKLTGFEVVSALGSFRPILADFLRPKKTMPSTTPLLETWLVRPTALITIFKFFYRVALLIT
jgi:hypothetical protein